MITVKKVHRVVNKVNQPSYVEFRREYSIWFNNFFIGDYRRLVFIDEISFNLHLSRKNGRSKRGTRTNVTVPTVRGRSITLISSLTINGMPYSKVVINSTVNANIFSEYIRELCRYLKEVRNMTGAVLIFDNAKVHRRENIEPAVREFEFNFKFLSPYSYMLNPIESVFSKIKNIVRARLRAGSTGALSDMVLEAVNEITPEDCSSYFRYMARNITNCAAGLPYEHI